MRLSTFAACAVACAACGGSTPPASPAPTPAAPPALNPPPPFPEPAPQAPVVEEPAPEVAPATKASQPAPKLDKPASRWKIAGVSVSGITLVQLRETIEKQRGWVFRASIFSGRGSYETLESHIESGDKTFIVLVVRPAIEPSDVSNARLPPLEEKQALEDRDAATAYDSNADVLVSVVPRQATRAAAEAILRTLLKR